MTLEEAGRPLCPRLGQPGWRNLQSVSSCFALMENLTVETFGECFYAALRILPGLSQNIILFSTADSVASGKGLRAVYSHRSKPKVHSPDQCGAPAASSLHSPVETSTSILRCFMCSSFWEFMPAPTSFSQISTEVNLAKVTFCFAHPGSVPSTCITGVRQRHTHAFCFSNRKV